MGLKQSSTVSLFRLSVEEAGCDAVRSRYEAGFAACVTEVGRYLTSVDVVPQLSAALPHLVNHLADCLRRRCRCCDTAPTTLKPVVTDEACVVVQCHGDEQADCDHKLHSARSHQQSSDDDFNFLQASKLHCVKPNSHCHG